MLVNKDMFINLNHELHPFIKTGQDMWDMEERCWIYRLSSVGPRGLNRPDSCLRYTGVIRAFRKKLGTSMGNSRQR